VVLAVVPVRGECRVVEEARVEVQALALALAQAPAWAWAWAWVQVQGQGQGGSRSLVRTLALCSIPRVGLALLALRKQVDSLAYTLRMTVLIGNLLLVVVQAHAHDRHHERQL
jgi:hypothetical protein